MMYFNQKKNSSDFTASKYEMKVDPWKQSWEAKKEQYVRSCGGRGRGALFYMRFKQL